jgi:hypothetical protein
VFNGQLYIAWTGTNSDNNLNVAVVEIDPETQAPVGLVPGTKLVLGYTSDHGTALASIDNGLFIAFAGKDSNTIFLDFINVGLATANNKPGWGPNAIPTDDRTKMQPALTAFENNLFLTWTGTDGGPNTATVNFFLQGNLISELLETLHQEELLIGRMRHQLERLLRRRFSGSSKKIDPDELLLFAADLDEFDAERRS